MDLKGRLLSEDHRQLRLALGGLLLVVLAGLLLRSACGGSGQSDVIDGAGASLTTDDSDQPGNVDANSGDDAASSEQDDGVADESVTDASESAQPEEAEDDRWEREPNSVVWVTELEPPNLHIFDPNNRLPVTRWINEGLLESLFGVAADLSYYPELLDGEPSLTVGERGDVTINYRLRADLTWSDGEPLTSDDVAYTHRILTEGCETEGDGSLVDGSTVGCSLLAGSRLGIDQVTSFEVVDDRSFTVTLSSFYPDWRSLYSPVLAEHAFGETASEANNRLQEMTGPDGLLPASGPLALAVWTPGESIRFVPNERYHGSMSPDALNQGPASFASLRLVFEPSAAERVAALVDGRADFLMDQPRPAHASLASAGAVDLLSRPGAVFEHLGMNLLNPHLSLPEVRRAIAFAVDKPSIVTNVFGPLFGSALPEKGLGNTYWLPSQAPYANNQRAFADANVEAAKASLVGAGYSPGADGLYLHPELGPLRLRIVTPNSDDVRVATQKLLAEQLSEAGFDIVIDSDGGDSFFTDGPFSLESMAASASGGLTGESDRWDLAVFGWEGAAWPGRQSGAYQSASSGNPYGYSNPEFDTAAVACDGISADDERAACYNDLDRFATTLDRGSEGLFVVPLTQRPTLFAANSSQLQQVAVAPDTVRGGPLVNAADYVPDAGESS